MLVPHSAKTETDKCKMLLDASGTPIINCSPKDLSSLTTDILSLRSLHFSLIPLSYDQSS